MFGIMRIFFSVTLLGGAMFITACDDRPEAAAEATPVEQGGASQGQESAKWHTNVGEALHLAGEQERPVLVNFTGSDWCPPCMMLKRDIFDTDAFKQYAGESLVLLEVDFPRSGGQPEELQMHNRMLAEGYKIEVFPTLLVLNAEGEEQKRHDGYMRGGPAALARWVED
jgi:thioredoxin-related protein